MPEGEPFRPDWASPPGETIADLLEQRGLSASELASRIHKPESYVQRLLVGHAALTSEVAHSLENNLGASARFWLYRESQYREALSALQTTTEQMSPDDFLNSLPINYIKKLGWIDQSGTPEGSVNSCLDYFDLPTIGAWQAKYYDSPDITDFRSSPTFQSQPGAVAAWLRRGEIESASIRCDSWNSQLFQRSLQNIRSLTREKNPTVFLPKLVSLCAVSGVAVVVARAPAGCRASGAARFLSSQKALILLSFRHLSDDHFWFTFFHEAGHLLLHDKHSIHIDGASDPLEKREQEANAFAAGELIPPELRPQMSDLRVNGREVMRFARRAGVSPGIVVGQLQFLGRLRKNQLNNLKRRYEWDEE